MLVLFVQVHDCHKLLIVSDQLICHDKNKRCEERIEEQYIPRPFIAAVVSALLSISDTSSSSEVSSPISKNSLS